MTIGNKFQESREPIEVKSTIGLTVSLSSGISFGSFRPPPADWLKYEMEFCYSPVLELRDKGVYISLT